MVMRVWSIRCLRNLLSNAIKFTPTGGEITITAEAPESSDFVEIAVSDSGIGLRPEDMEKLFKIDVYHTNTGTNDERGTGLGLIISQDMIHQNGGVIWVESQLGQGTTFRFTLPIKKQAHLQQISQ